ncbi:MAG: cupin domain-containing protein [Candidatus Bathyarchaeota archaeon]|nr:cupin domain-containing protein [Candidatus Bathyarchaeota archaeon]
MEMTKVSETSPGKNPHGIETKKIYDHENALGIHIKLQPGERLRRHITPVDVLFYVLEGEGVIEIGGEKKTVGQDTVIHSPAKIVHCWYNESEKSLRVLVVKTPRPVDQTILL